MTKRQLSLSNLFNSSYSTYLILGLIWLISNFSDRLWLSLNQAVPAWDQSNHLTNSLFYLKALQNSDFFNGEWWRQLWLLSPKYPPVTYIFGAIFQGLFGKGNDLALLTSFLYSGVLLICVYLLGKILFNREVGLWAAAITVLLPRLYQNRLQFLLDNPLLALVIASFTCLTYWKLEQNVRKQWLQMALFSLCLGLALLTKQSILFYLFFPLLFLTITFLWQRQWLRILQLILSFLGSTLIWYPWYRTNWIYLFSTAQNSNAIPAALEGDPATNTLAAWVYYAKDLPLAVSWVLLIIPIVGFLLHLLGRFPREKESLPTPKVTSGLLWLGLYFGGTYLICSALYNKDSRYIIPYLPILAIFLAYGLTRWRSRWYGVRWATIMLAIIVTLTNLYPIPFSDQFSQTFSPEVLFRPKFEARVPNQAVFETAIAKTPYQVVNIGVIPNTDQINPNTLNYFGTLANYQGSSRELGTNSEKVKEDSQNFQWFLRKTGENGFAQAPQLEFADQLPKDAQFKLIKNWSLADQSQLELYQQTNPFVTIKISELKTDQLQLQKITIPEKATAGFPLPISYQWSGNSSLFTDGLVLLTWRSQANPQ
ncbi:MAG: ArnT family glycosyltransferase, partial [Microcystaceae cyanobacterium]